MEVAPQELAQLLKLAGVGAGPEPDMPEPEMASEPEVSVMAIPSDDGAPVGDGRGAPEPEHDHGSMRGIIDMLQGGGEEPIEEPIEEAPPKDDYENASNEFTGHPVDVVDTYDQYSYEPAKNSGMQRRTNSYGDNPLREEDLIKEYTEFKKKPINEWDWNNKLGNLIGGKGWNTDQELKTAKDAEGPIDREPGAQKDLRLGSKGKRTFMNPQSTTWKNNMKARPGDLTKQVPNTLASTGVYDVEGPETALPGAQTRSNRQVATRNAQNAQNQTAVANTKGIKNDPRDIDSSQWRSADTQRDPRATAKQGPTAAEIIAHRGGETKDPRDIDPSQWRSAETPSQQLAALQASQHRAGDPNEIKNKGQSASVATTSDTLGGDRHDTPVATAGMGVQPAVSIAPGGTDAGTKGKTAGGSPHDTTSKLASISTDKIKDTSGPEILKTTGSNVAGPKQDNTPQAGETLQSIAARMGYPSIQAFIDAQDKGSIGQMKSGSNLGNYFVKKGRQYKPFGENVVGLGRNINRLKVLAGI